MLRLRACAVRVGCGEEPLRQSSDLRRERDTLDTSDKIRSIRGIRGWTQAELAAELGVSRRTVQGWEEATHEPSLRFVRPLERLAGKPRGWLLDENGGEQERGHATPGFILSVVATAVALMFPGPANATYSGCSGFCPPVRDGRQPRLKLARAERRRTIPAIGRVVLPDDVRGRSCDVDE